MKIGRRGDTTKKPGNILEPLMYSSKPVYMRTNGREFAVQIRDPFAVLWRHGHEM